MADVVTPNSIPSTLTRWIYIDMEHRKTICTSPNCMRAIPPDRIVSHCSKKHKKWSSKQQLRAFMEFVEQLGWSPSRDDEVTEDGLAPHPHLPVMDGLQCQHCPIRFQLLESEAAYQHRRIHGSLVGSTRTDVKLKVLLRSLPSLMQCTLWITPSLHLELGTLSLTFDFLHVLSGCLSVAQIEDDSGLSRDNHIIEVENIPTTAELKMDCSHDSNELTFQLRSAHRGLICISFAWEEATSDD
ncbi:hypothetical protein BKA64DRAFT_382145 [Cadophora sp. MPI-SDFR-AT-0126]|nr:hypothetical protein BKA64DRAFT_382145 [Leotiomycetes sp. MPI-SDFR-AT-0126]